MSIPNQLTWKALEGFVLRGRTDPASSTPLYAFLPLGLHTTTEMQKVAFEEAEIGGAVKKGRLREELK